MDTDRNGLRIIHSPDECPGTVGQFIEAERTLFTVFRVYVYRPCAFSFLSDKSMPDRIRAKIHYRLKLPANHGHSYRIYAAKHANKPL